MIKIKQEYKDKKEAKLSNPPQIQNIQEPEYNFQQLVENQNISQPKLVTETQRIKVNPPPLQPEEVITKEIAEVVKETYEETK